MLFGVLTFNFMHGFCKLGWVEQCPHYTLAPESRTAFFTKHPGEHRCTVASILLLCRRIVAVGTSLLLFWVFWQCSAWPHHIRLFSVTNNKKTDVSQSDWLPCYGWVLWNNNEKNIPTKMNMIGRFGSVPGTNYCTTNKQWSLTTPA